MYPDRDTLSNVPRSGYITARNQGMVESAVTEGGKNTASFLFGEWTLQHKNEASSKKATIFKVIPEEKDLSKHLKSGPSGNQLVLFSLKSWWKHQDLGKQN